MSLISANKTETNTYAVEIAVSAEDFRAAIQKAYLNQRKSIQIPGFRKGKAPLMMIEKLYGQEVFFEDALDIVFPETVQAAYEEAGINPVDQPRDFDVKTMSKEEGVVMSFNVTVKPEITLKAYKGLTAEKAEVKVTAEEIDHEIEHMLDRGARIVNVDDRAVKDGDITVIDFEGFVDGVAFDGGKAEKYELTIGSGSFIPGFEEQIIGHSIGEEFDVNVTFPEAYAPELASKAAVFKIKLHEIKVKELPALDDEFAKDVSEFDTLDELKKSVKAQLEGAKKADADNKVTNDLLEEVVKGMEVDIPAVMIEAEIDNIVDNFNYRLQSQGLDLNTYLSYTGMEMAAFREGYKENAEAQVKLSLAIEAIVKAEGIEATEDEVNAEYENLAKTYGMDVEAVKKAIPAESLAGDIKSKKAIDFVKDNAKVTEEKVAAKKTTKKAADDAEKPAKKPAAKKTTKKAADAE